MKQKLIKTKNKDHIFNSFYTPTLAAGIITQEKLELLCQEHKFYPVEKKWGQDSPAGDGKSIFINPFQEGRWREGTEGTVRCGIYPFLSPRQLQKSGISESFKKNFWINIGTAQHRKGEQWL